VLMSVDMGFLYLVAIMDWVSRKVLAWRLPNTMDTEFCIEALEEALGRYGKPEIFNRRAYARRGLRGRCACAATGGLTTTEPSIIPPPGLTMMYGAPRPQAA